jgi:hypothetical protein
MIGVKGGVEMSGTGVLVKVVNAVDLVGIEVATTVANLLGVAVTV